jgi:hypothetical protein
MIARVSVPTRARLEALLAELDARNADNVTRTESYLELYAFTRDHPPELPWLLMAHLVSRNGGYLMSDVARQLARDDGIFTSSALEQLFVFLERANFLIFWDAWNHVTTFLLGRVDALAPPRTSRFMIDAWRRFEAGSPQGAASRHLVRDLVTNEQNLIERRVVHNARFEAARAIVSFAEATSRDAPLALPLTSVEIRVGEFARLERRVATGWRIYDEVLADPGQRADILAWARAHPHDGSRAVYGGRAGPRIREAWPVDRVRSLWAGVHAGAEEDPQYLVLPPGAGSTSRE